MIKKQKRYPRPVKRYPRPVKRYPRPVDRYSKKIIRIPRLKDGTLYKVIRNPKGFEPYYITDIKPKEEFPDLYKDLMDLKEKFKKKNRKLSIHCVISRDNHQSALEVCITRCKKKCTELNFRNLVGYNESPAEYIDDFIKFQRLCNMIYGTVRKKDLKKKHLMENK